MGLIVANNLKLKRKQLGLTQQLISDLLNLERSTYAYYETGKTMPSIETLVKLSKLFDCSIEAIVTENDSEQTNVDSTEPIKVAKRLISKITMLSLNDRLKVEKLIDELIANKADKA